MRAPSTRARRSSPNAPSRGQRHTREAALADLHDELARFDLQALVGHGGAVDLHAALLDVAQRFAGRRHEARLLEQLADRQRRARERDRRNIVRHAALRAVVEVFERALGVALRVEARDDFLREQHLEIARIAARFDFTLVAFDLVHRTEREQREVTPHQRVGNRHQLAEHVVRLFADTDVVVLRLRHLFDAVETFEQRHGQDALLFLAVLLLQFAADQQIELLVRAAEFEVGVERDRVVTLHQRVKELVDRDRHAALEALGEVLALQNARDRVARRELDHAVGAERHRPFAVVADFGLFAVEHERGLLEIRLGVRLDLLARERRTRGVAARRVADQRGEVADQEDHGMAEILQLAHLVEHDRVADVDVGRGRIEAELDAQRLAGGRAFRELLLEFFFDQQFVDTALRDGERVTNFVGDRKGGFGAAVGAIGRCGIGAHASIDWSALGLGLTRDFT
ncbi:hypothetical protein PT2222_160058 [Paraburkholderia tropica]